METPRSQFYLQFEYALAFNRVNYAFHYNSIKLPTEYLAFPTENEK